MIILLLRVVKLVVLFILGKGRGTLTDLRVILLPFECVFVLSWIALWSHAYCEYNYN